MGAYKNLQTLFPTNPTATAPSPTPCGLPSSKIGVRTPLKIPIAIIPGSGKSTNFKFGQNNNRVEQKPIKNFGEKSVGVSRDCPFFSGTPYYLRYGKSYGFQIWPAGLHSKGPSEEKPIKIFWKKRERGRIQGLPNIFEYGVPPSYYLRNG